MKINIITYILFLFIGVVSYGQNKKPDFEKIKALKVAFFTERLNLTSKQAEVFWPIYNKYEKSRYQLGRMQHKDFSKFKNEDISEKQATELLKNHLNFEEEEEELDKTFTLKIQRVIGAKKTMLLLCAEKEFHRKLIKEYRKKHGGKPTP